jgi:hypothetical protein
MASPTSRLTMPSADFCGAIRAPHGVLSPVAGTPRRSPEVSSTAFATHPPDLQGPPLDGWGLRDPPLARPDGPASYPVLVHRVVALLHASFRRRLAETPLRFASTSPPSGCAGDLHPQAVEHARHTTKPLRGRALKRRRSAGRRPPLSSHPYWPTSPLPLRFTSSDHRGRSRVPAET